ncbi:MAG: hypothetical protein ACKO38_11945, partial [Planctomycetota bacterium]
MLAVAVWDGKSNSGAATPDDRWTTAANWVNDEAPRTGDYLYFPSTADRLTSNNDFVADTAFAGLIFAGDNYLVGGSAINIERGIVNEGLGNRLTLPLRLTNDQAFVSRGTLSIEAPMNLNGRTATLDGTSADTVTTSALANALSVSGVISGSGAVLATGGGTVSLTAANTFAGTIEVNGGRLILANSNTFGGVTTIRNDAVLELASGEALGAAGSAATGGVQVVGGGVIELSGGISILGESVSASSGFTLRANGGANTWSGAIAVTGTLVVTSTDVAGASIRLTGAVTAGELATSSSSGADHELAGPASISGAANISKLDVSNTVAIGGTLTISDSSVRSGATVSAASVDVTSTIVDGTVSASAAMQGGNVSGNGSLEYATGEFATLKPGDVLSPGRLLLGRVTGGTSPATAALSAFSPLILGATPGVTHDQLSVRGTLTLADTVFQPVINDFVPAMGQAFVIIDIVAVAALVANREHELVHQQQATLGQRLEMS